MRVFYIIYTILVSYIYIIFNETQAVVEVRKKGQTTKKIANPDEGDTISVETRTTLGVSLCD